MKILIAEDDVVLRNLLQVLLVRLGHQTIVAYDGTEALAVVRDQAQFDVAVLDWMMPGTSGPDVCRAIREVYVERRPFVLMLTAKSEPTDIVAALDGGADEFLTKPYRPMELAARMRVAGRLMTMQDELIAARRLVVYQATHDLASGALNRGAFLTSLHDLLVERQAAPSPVSVVRIGVGAHRSPVRVDEDVMRAMVERVRAHAPAGALIGRTGEQELLIVLPDADEKEADAALLVIKRGVDATPLVTPLGPVTVRIETNVVTARTVPELDLAWMLCVVDAMEEGAGGVGDSGERFCLEGAC
jgi:DNA-binding response OmpR family regulator